MPVVINRLESKRWHSVLFGFSVWENRIDNSFFPTSGEMQTVCKSDAVIRLNFEIMRVKRGPQTFAEIFKIFSKSLGSPFHLKFQILSSGVMTVFVLKTCISYKKFQSLARYFRRCFGNPKSNNTGLASW